jgi:hypothetical protein
LSDGARPATDGSAHIELWFGDLEALAEPLLTLDEDAPLLTAGERESLSGTRRTARMALRLLIGRFFGSRWASQPFAAGAHGKPTLPGLAGDFNIAHTASAALVGLGCVTAIGVDLEPLRQVRLDARRRLAIAEAAIRVADGADLPIMDEARTLQAWARLEALGKADGLGIGRTLSRLGVWGRPIPIPAAGSYTSEDPDGSAPIAVRDVLAGAGFYAAVAVPRGTAVPSLRSLPLQLPALAAIRAGASPEPNSAVDLGPAAGHKGRIGA